MANETVSFEITANTENASKAITELQRKLNAMARIETTDKDTKAQQKVFAQMNKDLDGILEKEKDLGRHYTTYASRAKRVEKLTKEYEDQDVVLQKFIARQDELQAKSANGTITPAEVNELSRTTATVNNLTEKQAAQLKKINTAKRENEKLDRAGKNVLKQLVDKYGEIKSDESSVLGLKLEQVKGTEQAVASEGELDKEVNKTNSSLDKQAQSAKRAKSEFDKATNKSNRTKNIKQIVGETKNIEEQISNIEKRASKVLSQPMAPNKFTFGDLKRRKEELEDVRKAIESIGTPKELDDFYQRLTVELDRVKQGMTALHKETKTTNKDLVTSTKQVADTAEDTAKRIEALKEQAISAMSMPMNAGEMDRGDLDQRIKQLEQIQSEIKKLGIPAELKEQYNQLGDELVKLKQKKYELDKAIKTPIEPKVKIAEVKTLDGTLKEVASTTTQVDKAMQTDPATNNIAELLRRISALQEAKKTIESLNLPAGADATYNKIIQLLATLTGQVSEYKKKLTDTSKEHEKTKKTGTTFAKTLSSAFKSLKGSMSTLDRTTGKVKSSFDSMARSMKSNFKHMITNITKYVLGFRSLFFLVRRLRKYIGEGIQNMAQFNDGNNHVNESITRLLSSLLYLKNAWATAFSPILQFVTPMLERLIDKMAEVGNAFSRFLGSLLGTTTVFQAVKVDAADYADSLDKAAGSAGSAADKTKKLTDRLAAFDDLNVLGKDNDPDGTGSGGGGGLADAYEPDPNEMFTLIDVGKEVLEQFKQMWEDADFTELGKNLKYKLITALLTAQENLEEFKEPAYKVGKSIITFLNGVFGDKTIWVEAGKTLGKTVNVVSEFIRGLLENNEVDWGGGLASLINGFFASTDWETIRANIVLFATQFKDNVISFLKTLDWEGDNGIFEAFKSLGSAIGTAISETVGDAEFMGSLGDALGKLISAILITWKAILDQNDGDEIGNALYEFFASLIDAINWDTLAENLSGSLVLLLNAISKFSENLSEDDTFQQALSDFVENLDLDTVFEALGRNISSSTVAANSIGSVLAETLGNKDVVNKVTEGMKTLIESIDYNSMISSTVDFLGNLLGSALADPTLPIKIAIAIVEGLINGLSTALSQWLEGGYEWAEEAGLAKDGDGIGEQIVNGLIGGIAKAFEDDPLYNFFKEHFFDPTVKAIKDLFNIDSPSKEMETLGGYIGEGLLNGISNFMPNVEQIFTDFHEWLIGKWDEVKGDTYEKWVGIRTNVTEKAQELKDNAEEKVEALKTSLVGKWQEIKGSIYEKLVGIKTNVLEVFDQLKEGIKNPINGFIDIIEGMVNRVIDGINSLTSALNVLPDIQMTNPITGTEYTLGFTIPTLNPISIPRLAQGAVIPPNREFMAVLGDQSHGTNIEAPLDTIKQAVAEVIANNGNEEVINLLQQLITVVESKNLVIGDKEIGKANARYVNQQKLIRGTSI